MTAYVVSTASEDMIWIEIGIGKETEMLRKKSVFEQKRSKKGNRKGTKWIVDKMLRVF